MHGDGKCCDDNIRSSEVTVGLGCFPAREASTLRGRRLFPRDQRM